MAKPKKSPAPNDSLLGQVQDTINTDVAARLDRDPMAPLPVNDAAAEARARLEREDRTTTSDYIGAAYRQDSFVDPMIAHVVGQQYAPQDGYTPFDDEEWKQLSEGVWPDFHRYLYEAHSPEHGRWTRELILQKQNDLTMLGDLGWKGMVGRFALGAVAPENFLLGLAGGWVAKGVQAARTAKAVNTMRAAKTSGQQVDAAVDLATAAEKLALEKSTGKSIALAMAGGAAANVGVEKLRQSVAFEDDSGMLLEAGLLGAAMVAPFAAVGARRQRRLYAAAVREKEALEALRAASRGEDLTPAQLKTVDDTLKSHQAVQEFQGGKIDIDELNKRLDDILDSNAPTKGTEEFLAGERARLKAESDAFLAKAFPNRGEPLPKPISAAERAKLDGRKAKEDQAWAEQKAAEQPAPAKVPDAWQDLLAKASPTKPMTKMQEQMLFAATERRRGAEQRQAAAAAEAELKATQKSKQDAFDALDAQKEADFARMEAEQQQKIGSSGRDTEIIYSASQGGYVIRERIPGEAGYTQLEGVYASEAEARDFLNVVLKPAEPDTLDGLVGDTVFWSDDYGNTVTGTVIDTSGQKFIVETPDGQRMIMGRGELDPASPGFQMEAPSGFFGGSIGSGQIAAVGSAIDGKTPMTHIGPVPIRFDISARLAASDNPFIKELGFKLVKDPIGFDPLYAQGATASEYQHRYRRQVAGEFHVTAREAANDAARKLKLSFWKTVGWKKDFYEMVSKVTRGDKQVLADNPLIAAELQKASGAQRKALDTMIEEAKKWGVRGAEDVVPDDYYVNRVWSHKNIRSLEATHGTETLVGMIADSILDKAYIIDRYKKSPTYRGNPVPDDEILKIKARSFLRAVKRTEFSQALQDVHLRGKDMATVRNELSKLGMDEDMVDSFVDFMFIVRETTNPDSGRAANLKYRFGLDENHQVQTKDGRITLSDLLENDSRLLTDLYVSSMGGHTALARVGIPDRATFDAKLREADDWWETNKASEKAADRFNKDKEVLNDAYRHIIGMPMSTADFSYMGRAAAAFRGYTRSVMLGQLGIVAAFESAQIMGYAGGRAFFQQMPTLRGIIQGVRTGRLPAKQLVQDIEMMLGLGNEMASGYARQHELADGFYDRGLSRFEELANKASHAGDVLSGNAGITSASRQMAGMVAIQNYSNLARDLRKLTAKQRQRMVGNGVDDDSIESVLGDLKRFSETTQHGTVTHIKYEDWANANATTYDSFLLLIEREARSMIQDHDLGETMHFMHTPLGKLFGELRTFFFVAHAKNFLKNAHYRDMVALQAWGINYVAQMLAYTAQTALNYGGDPAELEKRMTLDKIMSSAFARSASNGAFPFLLDTPYSILNNGETLFSGGTAITDNRNFFLTPSMQVGARLKGVPQNALGYLFNNESVTKRELKDSLSSFPLTNLPGIRMGIEAFSSMQPSREPPREP